MGLGAVSADDNERQAVRAGNPEPPPEGCLPGEKRLPSGTLRKWHWRALAKAYTAGDDGLAGDGMIEDYGGIGFKTWRRLKNYQAGPFGALVETRQARICPGHLRPRAEHRLFITADGRRLYEERFGEYSRRYPNIAAGEAKPATGPNSTPVRG